MRKIISKIKNSSLSKTNFISVRRRINIFLHNTLTRRLFIKLIAHFLQFLLFPAYLKQKNKRFNQC
ncbi:hypothetical protein Ocin01_17817, partial [Orchesella cincta]